MLRRFKILLFILLGVLLLLVTAAVVLALTVDPNRYKPQLIELVQKKTHRTLAIPGEIRLMFFPRLGAELGRFSLSEPGAPKAVFASGEHIQMAVALWPLLSKRIVVDQIVIDGASANIHHFSNGKTNYDDLVAKTMRQVKKAQAATDSKAKDRAPADANDEAESPIELDIAGVSITRAALSYVDDVAQREFKITELNLNTGPIAQGKPSHFELDAALKGDKPPLALKLEASSKFTLDLDQQMHLLQDARVSLQGQAVGLTKLRLTLSAPTVEFSPHAVQVPSLSIDTSARRPAAHPDAPAATELSLGVRGTLSANLQQESLQTKLNGQFDGNAFELDAGLMNFAHPRYRFDLRIAQLNVDRYLPPPAKPDAAKEAAAPAADTPVDLSALAGVNASGKLQIDALQVAGVKSSDLRVDMKADKGQVELAPMSALLYEGRLDGALKLQAGVSSRIDAKLKLAQIQLGPLLNDALALDLIEGRSDVALDVRTGGATVNQFKKALSGTASVALKDGAIRGINLAEALRRVKGGKAAQDTRAEKTDLSELSASFTIDHGVAHNEDLNAKSPLLRLAGKGDIDLPASRIDYLLRTTIVPTLKGQEGPEMEELKGLTVPVRLQGPFTDIGWKIELDSAVRERAEQAVEKKKDEIRSKAQQAADKKKDQLRSEADKAAQKQKQDARSQIENRLKGVFGR